MTSTLSRSARRPGTSDAILAASLSAALILAGCGGSEDEQTPDDSPAATADGGSETADDTTTDGATEEPGTGDPTSEEPGTDASGLLPPAEGATDYPLTLTTPWGETTLEKRPERVAVLGFSTNSDILEALEVVPVYALTEDGDWEWRSDDWLNAVEFTDTATRRDPFNFEGIAATDPDLIVATNFLYDQADYDRLATIAPVLEQPEEVVGELIDWQETQHLVAETLDLRAASEQVVADAEAEIAAVGAAHPELEGKTITIATEYSTGLEYYTVAGGTAEQALGEIGFVPNPLAEEFVDDVAVSDENVGRLDADALVVIYVDEAAKTAREESPLFQAIPAVADGRYVGLADGEDRPETGLNATWVFRRGASALSLPWALDVVAENWLADIDLS